METATVIRTRIFNAASELYEESDRIDFPTVDAVRKRARVNMNEASTCMREWRRIQKTQAAPATVEVPPAVQQVAAATLAELWSAAVALAAESMRSAQAQWDAERAEADTLAEQMANAFEEQSAELRIANASVAELREVAATASVANGRLERQLADIEHDLDTARDAARLADIRATEIERRADDLCSELDRAHQYAATAREERVAAQLRADRELDAVRADMRKAKDDAELECAHIRAALAEALATASRLRGQLDALTVPMPATGDGTPRPAPPPGR
jgi:colicin import membrane protein